MTSTTSTRRPARWRGPTPGLAALTRRLDAPTATYHVLIAVTSVLVLFGLIMVLSASAVQSLTQSRSGTPFAIFNKQFVFALLGSVALVIASRMSVSGWRRIAIPVWLGSVVLQILVFTPLGVDVAGNANWIKVGPVTMQPSELVKLGLVLVGALVMDVKRDRLGEVGHVVMPYLVPVTALSAGLVLAGSDLGTAIVLAAIVGAVLFAAGVPLRWFAVVGAVGIAGAAALVVSAPHRLQRFDVWLGRDTNIFGAARQPMHGRYALADGGWLGLGLGASREKWQLLSEPHNDFIFAIIGEELGLPGTLMVLVLFLILAWACLRIVQRSRDRFVKIATAGALAWILSQAMVNIGSVIGVLPVIGVPLPLVSSGGSSLITTMLCIGMLISFARAEPGAREALAGRGSILRRTRAVLPSVRRGLKGGS